MGLLPLPSPPRDTSYPFQWLYAQQAYPVGRKVREDVVNEAKTEDDSSDPHDRTFSAQGQWENPFMWGYVLKIQALETKDSTGQWMLYSVYIL